MLASAIKSGLRTFPTSPHLDINSTFPTPRIFFLCVVCMCFVCDKLLLTDTNNNTVKDFELFRNKCSRNSEKISQLSAWVNVIKGWTDIYN